MSHPKTAILQTKNHHLAFASSLLTKGSTSSGMTDIYYYILRLIRGVSLVRIIHEYFKPRSKLYKTMDTEPSRSVVLATFQSAIVQSLAVSC